MIKLTSAMENYNERSERDKEDRNKSDAFMMNLSNKINAMQADLAGIKEQLKK